MRLLNHTYTKSTAFDTHCHPESLSSLIPPPAACCLSSQILNTIYCILKKKEKIYQLYRQKQEIT